MLAVLLWSCFGPYVVGGPEGWEWGQRNGGGCAGKKVSSAHLVRSPDRTNYAWLCIYTSWPSGENVRSPPVYANAGPRQRLWHSKQGHTVLHHAQGRSIQLCRLAQPRHRSFAASSLHAMARTLCGWTGLGLALGSPYWAVVEAASRMSTLGKLLENPNNPPTGGLGQPSNDSTLRSPNQSSTWW